MGAGAVSVVAVEVEPEVVVEPASGELSEAVNESSVDVEMVVSSAAVENTDSVATAGPKVAPISASTPAAGSTATASSISAGVGSAASGSA